MSQLTQFEKATQIPQRICRLPLHVLLNVGSLLSDWDCKLGSVYSVSMAKPANRVVGRVLALVAFGWMLLAKYEDLRQNFDAGLLANRDILSWFKFLYQGSQAGFLVIIVTLVLVRRNALTTNARITGIFIALVGTVAPSLLIYGSNVATHTYVVIAAETLLLAGMAWAIWGLVTLGRCFSIVPEVRGLVTGGPYHWIRHPIYLGEIIATLGVLLPILSPVTLTIFVIFCVLQFWRTRYEESVLNTTFLEYKDYRQRTARLIPGLW